MTGLVDDSDSYKKGLEETSRAINEFYNKEMQEICDRNTRIAGRVTVVTVINLYRAKILQSPLTHSSERYNLYWLLTRPAYRIEMLAEQANYWLDYYKIKE